MHCAIGEVNVIISYVTYHRQISQKGKLCFLFYIYSVLFVIKLLLSILCFKNCLCYGCVNINSGKLVFSTPIVLCDPLFICK